MSATAGILLIFMSLAHFIYGERKQILLLKQQTDDSIQIGSLRIMIVQGGMIIFAVGIIQILISIKAIILIGVAQYFPVSIVFINTIIAFFITLLYY